MTRFLLLVKNIIEHTDSIYNTQPIHHHMIKQNLERCCEDLLNTQTTISQLPNIDINVYDTYAEIVYTTETVSKGWIYNSNIISKQVAVLVQCVPLLDTQESSVSVACQTESNGVEDCTVTFPAEYPNNLPHEFLDDLSSYDSNTVEISSDTYSQSLLPVIASPTPTYTGYANTLLFPTWRDQFTIELKQKLAQPNLGLRPNSESY